MGYAGIIVDGVAAEEDLFLGEGQEVVWPAHCDPFWGKSFVWYYAARLIRAIIGVVSC